MADKRILQERIVRFGITGMDEVYDAQKKITSNARAALKDQKELLKTLEEGTEAYKKQSKNVDTANKYYERQKKLLDDLLKQTNTIKDVIENRTVESAKKMESAIKAIIKGVKSISLKDMDEGEAEKMRGHIAGLVKDMTGLQAQVHAIGNGFQDMTAKLKISDLTIEEATRYIKTFEQHGRALADSTENSGAAFAKMGENATNLKLRIAVLDGTLKKLSDGMSREEVEKNMNFWKQMSEYSHASTEQVKLFTERYREAQGLLIDKSINKLSPLAITYQSPDDIKKSVEYLQKIAQEENLNAAAQEKVNDAIARGTDYLKKFHDVAKYKEGTDMFRRMSIELRDIGQLTKEGITEQQKYWETVKNKAKEGSNEMRIATENLKALNEETARRESERVKAEGATIVGQVNTGVFAGTIKETEEAIQKIQAYKKELGTDPEGMRAVTNANTALDHLNKTLEQTKQEVTNGKTAWEDLRVFANGSIKDIASQLPRPGEQLKKTRADLEAFKKSLEDFPKDPVKHEKYVETLQEIEKILTAIDQKEKGLAASEITWDDYKGPELKKRSLDELKKAYDALKDEIASLSPAQSEYNEKAMQMREIDKRVKQLNKTLGDHKTSLENAASRLKNYVLIYFGWRQAMGIMKKVFDNTIELSDQMTNVRKVTGLTNLEIERMTRDLQALDTRTANQQLMEMAEQAGKLGVATRQGADGIVEFVKAGQEIVNTLGDIGGAEAITELLKVNDVVNKNATSIEVDLGKIGSAILNIGNNSKATYADITEFTKRLGATGSAIGLSMEEIMGLGGAFSSLGESMERSATASQRVLLGIVTRTKEVSQALNISYEEMDKLIQSGDAMGAFMMALKALNEQGVSSMEGFFKAIGGRNNQQARAAIALLSQHIDTLQYQVALAKEGFSDGTLVTQEYQKANDNLAGVMARVQNELYEMTTAIEASNGLLLDAAKVLLDFVKWLHSSSGAMTAFGGVLAYVVVQLGAFLVSIPKVSAMLNMMKIQLLASGKALGNFAALLLALPGKLLGIEAASKRATASLNALKAAGATTWITALITAIGMLIGYLVELSMKAKEAAKQMGEMKQKADEEMYSLERLVSTLRRVWGQQKERQKGIDEFNKKFGAYYGHLLKETASLNDLAIAYKAVAKAALEKHAAEMEAKAETHGLEVSREEREEASGELATTFAKDANFKNFNQGRGLSRIEADNLQSELEQSVLSYWGDESIGNKSTEGAMQFLLKKYANDPRVLSKFQQGRGYVNLLKPSTDSPWQSTLYGSLKKYSEATAKGYQVQQRDIREAGNLRGMAAEKARQQADRIYKQLTAPDRELSAQERYDLGNEYVSLQAQYAKKAPDTKVSMIRSQMEGMWDWSGGKKNQWTSYELPGTKQENAVDNWNALSSGLDRTEEIKAIVSEAAKEVHPWGKISMDSAGQTGEALAMQVKFFNDFYNQAKEGQMYSKTSAYRVPAGVNVPQDIDSWTMQQVRDWAYKNWQEAIQRQKDQNFDNAQGNFKEWKEGGGGGKSNIKTEMKEEMDATLKKLEEYYERRSMMAEKYLNEGQISEEEYNRYMFANEQEHLKERQNLRRKWLDSDHEFMTEGVKDLMKGVDFQKLSKFLKGMGQDMVDGIKLNIAKDENEVEKNIRASREKVMKVLLDERPIAKVAETFTQDLADLGVLFGNADEAMLHVGEDTRQMMAERMSFLMKEAKKGYALTASELLKDAKKTGNPSIKAWMESLSPEALSALVLKTQGFYDEYEDAVRKMIKKMEKRIEFERNQVGADGMSQNQRWEEAKKRLERQQHTQGVAESWGMAGNNVAGVAASENMQVDALQKELEIKRELYELEKVRYAQELNAIKQRIYMEGDPEERAALIEEAEALKTAAVKAEAEAWQGVEEAQRNATQAQFELMSQTVDQIKPYYDDLNSFAENFGENIFGSKADRQQAARDLLASVIKTTGQMLTQWLVYVSTKQMFDKMEVMNEQAKQSQLLAIKLQAQAAEMQALGQTAQAEETVKLAQNATDAASAQAKEAAKAGWIGWAIGAGLSLLMTMVFSALSAKAKGAIASATGVSGSGKLATGMLTYGKGRYPVYAEGVYANDGSGRTQGQLVSVPGNDGRTYMAKYQPNLKTGVVNSPHLGIVGEKGAELIVDHQTYEGLRRYDPETLRRIYAMRAYGTRSIDFERTARMGNEVVMNRGGVRAYADGNIDEKLGGMDDGTNAYDGTMVEMKQTLADLTVVLATIKETGIDAHMNYFGRNGAWETDKRGQKFLKRKGIT